VPSIGSRRSDTRRLRDQRAHSDEHAPARDREHGDRRTSDKRDRDDDTHLEGGRGTKMRVQSGHETLIKGATRSDRTTSRHEEERVVLHDKVQTDATQGGEERR